MYVADASKFQTTALLEFDDFMLDAITKIPSISALAIMFWSDVLRELERRGKVTLISGSFDDIGNALIKRNS